MAEIGPKKDGKINAKEFGFDFGFRLINSPVEDFDERLFSVEAYTALTSLKDIIS